MKAFLKQGDTEGSCSPYDANGDGVEDLEDIIYVLRALDDPLLEVTVGDPSADVNRDGVVDLQDAIDAIVYFTDLLGADVLGDVTPTYFDDDGEFPWDQPPLDDRRRLHSSRSTDSHAPEFLRSRQVQDADTCGADSALTLAKGSGPDPTIGWDFGNCVYDPDLSLSISERLAAHASWVKYGILVSGAAVLGIPDGARAYNRYRANTGAELAIDYEKAIRDDPVISSSVDQEIDAVRAAVKELFDSQNSFSFYSTSARGVPNGSTENWQKAIGGHRIWSVGSVSYDAGSCALTIDVEVKAEDYYNFNPGQRDIASGLPDDDNCLFAELGWAKAFFSRGSVTRTETVALQCCRDTDCGAATEFECECNLCTTQCPTQQRSGGQGFTSFTVELFKNRGTIQVFYEMYSIPDELNVYYEGSTIFSTGGLVSGSTTVSVPYGSDDSTSTVVTVEVNAPRSGTAWIVSVTCPE